MTTFQARIDLLPGSSAPDEYTPSKVRTPPDDFVVTRNKDGTALSHYGDLKWDRTPYDPESKEHSIYFKFWDEGDLTPKRDQLVRELRWLMFILIYLRPGASLSTGSLNGYLDACKAIARFCEFRSLRIQQVLADPILLPASIQNFAHQAKRITPIITLLQRLGPDMVGFDVVNNRAVKELEKISAAWRADLKQHPPIPTRLYSLILSAIAQELDEFEQVADRVLALYIECAEDPLVGRCKQNQWKTRKKKNLKDEQLHPLFPDLLRKYDLEEFWLKRGYGKSINGLSVALIEILVASSLQIQAFTGMRINEVNSLPYSCLDEVRRGEDGSVHYIVSGRVTKLSHGKIKRVQWVTSESGRRAIRIAQRISLAIYQARGQSPEKSKTRINCYYLFISPGYGLGWEQSASNAPANIAISKPSLTNLRLRLQPIIQEEDLLELERIDPHRTWRTEELFQIGTPWRLTTHQMRRSLALYAQRSGLVSLPTLKRQLQHITQEMALYYARGSAFAKNFIGDVHELTHFGEEWQATQPISQFLSYAHHVLLADQTDLFGVHPLWVKTHLTNDEGIVVFDRAKTMKQFQKGELAYNATPIGGCANPGPCDKNPVSYLHAECLKEHCKHMVGNKKKLERVILAQTNMVRRVEKDDPDSPEYRLEKANLNAFKETLEEVSKASTGSKKAS